MQFLAKRPILEGLPFQISGYINKTEQANGIAKKENKDI